MDCFRKCFDTNDITKARLYITACGVYEAKMNSQRCGNFILAPGVTDYRKRMQYQTIDVTELLMPGKNTFDLYCERFPADRAGILMDFYWLAYACQKPIASIEKYRDRLGIVHFKDMTMNEKGERIFTEIYNGCIDYTAIFHKLEEIGGKWAAIEEDVCPCGDPFRALAISLENIKQAGLPFENL